MIDEDDWAKEAMTCSAQGTTPHEKKLAEKKGVEKQLAELLAKGLVDKDPYILVDVHGKVITVDAKKHMDRANKFKEILVRHAKFFHHWFHKGTWKDCKKSACREVLDAVEEE